LLPSYQKSLARRTFEQRCLAPIKGFFRAILHKTESTTTVQGDDTMVDHVAHIAIFFIVLTMIIVPLWVLVIVDGIFGKLGIITEFTLILLIFLSYGTLARPFETLASTAGYNCFYIFNISVTLICGKVIALYYLYSYNSEAHPRHEGNERRDLSC
jgi:hypothetical protein